jgi:hypothetical protein
MSHRYRIAFRETLCGFTRDRSSFRETTVAVAGGRDQSENSRLVRIIDLF